MFEIQSYGTVPANKLTNKNKTTDARRVTWVQV